MSIAEVELRIGSGKTYTFEIPPFLKLSENDTVVVLCDPRGCGRDEFAVGRVAEVFEDEPFAIVDGLKPVVDVADTARYKDYVSKKEKAESIKRAMGERLEEANKMQLYRQLAASDPTMKKLLDELEELEKAD